MKASTALLSALVPLATASAVFRNNADVLRSAESILHGLNTNHYYGQGLHTTEDGLKTIAQVTLHNEIHGNITYEDGVLWARKDVEPTIWNLNQDCRRDSKGFQISVFDPFDRAIYWKTNYDKVTLGDNEYYDGSSRFLIRVANDHKGDDKNNGQTSMADTGECEDDGKKPGHLPPGGEGDDEWQVMYIATSNSGCVYFNDEGMSKVGTVSACHPFKFKQVHDSDVPVWEDPNAHCPSA